MTKSLRHNRHNRHNRHTPSHVTHSDAPVLPSQASHTPIGCDVCDAGRLRPHLVPMPPFLKALGSAVGDTEATHMAGGAR